MLAYILSVTAIAAVSAQPATQPAQTPTALQVRSAIEKSLPFVEAKGLAWLDNKKCIACHHGAWMVWSLNEAKRAGITVDPTKLDAITSRVVGIYLKDVPGHQKKKAGWVESAYMLMSQYDDSVADQKPAEWRTDAAGIIVAGQQKDGSWKYAGQGLDRPADENDEATTLWALQALPKGDKAESAARETAMAYLKTVKPEPGLDSLALRLALEVKVGDPARASALKDELIARQNADGGWKWSEKRAADAFATGEAIYILSLAGVRSDSPAIQKAWTFLVSTQSADGSWRCLTRKPTGGEEISTYWGTTWAVIGLSRTLPPRATVSEAR